MEQAGTIYTRDIVLVFVQGAILIVLHPSQRLTVEIVTQAKL
jgi:hypothetical protein